MEYLKLTFEDIAQQNILYYDKEVEAACFNICDTLHIDNMPDYDSKHYYEKVGVEEFEKKLITNKHKLMLGDGIFKKDWLKKFESNDHNVLFVFEGQILKGIVHFSDYNQNKVLQAIQNDILEFERKLRLLLSLNDFKNEHLLDYLNNKGKSKSFWRNRWEEMMSKKVEMDQFGEFQMFYLSDLLYFANSSKSNKIFPTENVQLIEREDKISQIKVINDLRNMAMHGKNLIELEDNSSRLSIYSLNSLKILFESLEILKQLTYKLDEKIVQNESYMTSVKMDNRSKLTIIHKHHPSALKYFIPH